jgi:hypothetical protein
MTFDRSLLTVGSAVFTSDGEKIGEVKEVSGDLFKVDVSMRPDYWVSCNNVASATSSGVTLSFGKDQLGDYKADAPAASS